MVSVVRCNSNKLKSAKVRRRLTQVRERIRTAELSAAGKGAESGKDVLMLKSQLIISLTRQSPASREPGDKLREAAMPYGKNGDVFAGHDLYW